MEPFVWVCPAGKEKSNPITKTGMVVFSRKFRAISVAVFPTEPKGNISFGNNPFALKIFQKIVFANSVE